VRARALADCGREFIGVAWGEFYWYYYDVLGHLLLFRNGTVGFRRARGLSGILMAASARRGFEGAAGGLMRSSQEEDRKSTGHLQFAQRRGKMPQFATFDDLSRITRGLQVGVLLKEAARTKTDKTVFLSHSSKDKEHLPAVISILENHGGRVYIDNEDDRLPKTPDRETAEILRGTVKACRRFVLFVTTNSKESRWIPWELGLADGEKGQWPVALFPTAEKKYEQTWSTTEYLGLYRRIVWGKIKDVMEKNGWIVLNHEKNTAVTLRRWLTEG